MVPNSRPVSQIASAQPLQHAAGSRPGVASVAKSRSSPSRPSSASRTEPPTRCSSWPALANRRPSSSATGETRNSSATARRCAAVRSREARRVGRRFRTWDRQRIGRGQGDVAWPRPARLQGRAIVDVRPPVASRSAHAATRRAAARCRADLDLDQPMVEATGAAPRAADAGSAAGNSAVMAVGQPGQPGHRLPAHRGRSAAALGVRAVGDAYTTAPDLPGHGLRVAARRRADQRRWCRCWSGRRKSDADRGEAYTQRLLTLAVIVLGVATVLAVIAAPAADRAATQRRQRRRRRRT